MRAQSHFFRAKDTLDRFLRILMIYKVLYFTLLPTCFAAMMIEFMAGKSAAMHGLIHDASPFKFGDDESAIDYFGELLAKGLSPLRAQFSS